MTKKIIDKRYFPRIAISLDGSVKNREKLAYIKIIDLTVEGISFQLEQALPIGTIISVDLDTNEDIRCNDVKVETLRCNLLENITPPQYIVAAKFIDANDEYLMDSLALIHGNIKRNK